MRSALKKFTQEADVAPKDLTAGERNAVPWCDWALSGLAVARMMKLDEGKRYVGRSTIERMTEGMNSRLPGG